MISGLRTRRLSPFRAVTVALIGLTSPFLLCRRGWGMSGRAGLVNQNILDTAMFVDSADSGQGSLFLETARLSETFYEQLKKHPVPLEEAARE